MQKLSKFILVLSVVATTATVALADSFINGGFENGNFTSWTKDGGTWSAGNPSGEPVIYNNTGDPSKSTTIHDANGLISASVFDANTGGALAKVLSGNYSAEVNNADKNSHYSTLTQTVNDYTDNDLYFGFASVLLEPSNPHPETAAPHFAFSIYDNTLGKSLYDIAFNVYNAADSGLAWHDGLTVNSAQDGAGTWKYSDWNVIHVDTGLLSGLNGDSFTVTVAAYDCGWGGHGGYAYVDDFQAILPTPNAGVTMNLIEANNIVTSSAVPEPTAIGLWLMGGLVLLWYGKHRRSSIAA